MNSLKSLCSFAKRTPLALGQLQKDVKPLLGCELRVELIVGVFGRLEAWKDSNASIHTTHFTTRERDPVPGISEVAFVTENAPTCR